jgi:hypothetical protein
MPVRKSKPFRWSPVGCSDSLDTTEVFPGAMAQLQNLVPDPTTKDLWVPRPASQKLYGFADFTTPGFVSSCIVVGTKVYGTIASARFSGYDEPFCYDLLASAYIGITGPAAGNVPLSPPATGSWTPPSLDIVGVYVVVCHPGFPNGTNFVGWINIANPAAPTWTAGNTSVNALPCAPTAVAQFNGRAYYLCNPSGAQPAALATDSLDPTKRTNATYVLTFDDSQPLTAAKGLPLDNQLGGIIQSLMVFKGSANVYQITGDFASTSSPIQRNALNVATGTQSPLSICTTPKGIAFISPDGLRFIDFEARLSDPVGTAGAGVSYPFYSAVLPSRVVAACNSTTIRISVQNGSALGNPQQEWWYNLVRGVWSGPHTFPASLIQPYGRSFIMTPLGVTASLWQSDVAPIATSSYTENGVALSWTYQTAFFPDQQAMSAYNVTESYIDMALAVGGTGVSVVATDEHNQVLSSVRINPSGAVSLWGSLVWGAGLWGGAVNSYDGQPINWDKPLTFDRLQVTIQGASAANVRLGALYGRWQALGFLPGGGA